MPNRNVIEAEENPWKKKPYIMLDFKDEDMVLAEDGKAVKMKEDAEIFNANRLRNSLVIKVFGKELSSHIVAWEVRRQWKPFGNFHFTTLGKGWFLFSFDSTDIMEGILSGGPWFVNGHIVGIERWTVEFSTLSLKGLTSPIWIRMPHLPLQCWDEVNVARIASSVGKPIMMVGNMFQWSKREFSIISMRVKLDQQLPLGVWVESISGRFFQKFEYKKISTFCYNCGLIGHVKSDLKNRMNDTMERIAEVGKRRPILETKKSISMDTESSYGPWIMVKRNNRRPERLNENPKIVKK
ncbi:uncharacterized protein LOC110096540 [Dendrobium catenatum]|uniref:uncharacterized protein LOC110096540 n=1 Tax=Dendrobium catenatum TaxID=906689 RepID=UPI0009F737EA|nr:uncharacterized protein LOC110096540 [Dendrobium catenatum]